MTCMIAGATPRGAVAAAFFCIAGMVSFPVTACQVLTKEQAEEARKTALDEVKTAIRSLQSEADQVFIGQLAELTSHQEDGRASAAGASRLQQFQARFQSVQNIKGQYTAGHRLGYAVDRGTIVVGCTVPFRQVRLREGQVDESYLVYAREGRILRATPVPLPYEVIDGRQEAALVRSLQQQN